ncbi:MAG: hypothetical protein HY236_02345 [Acidobacteria bacterium]|nr:hypothetical protein [Acidobacteriota bacterium]
MLDPKLASCKGKCIALITLIFASGMAAGAFGLELAERYWLRPGTTLSLNGPDKVLAVQHLSHELDLDETQARAIENILDELIMEQANLMAEFKNSRLTSHKQIIQVLNEDQRKRYQKIVSELNSRQRD